MKTKKELYNLFYGKNYDNLYSGFSGYLFGLAHEKLEIEEIEYKNQDILEIGPGRKPHYAYLKYKETINSYHLFEPDAKTRKFLKNKFKNFNKCKILNTIPRVKYDRIILSHVLEHAQEPEIFLNSLLALLKKKGTISITIPCDPGFLWELGRSVNYYNFWRKKKVQKKEYLYHMSSEHINPAINLIRIINYRYKKIHECFLPFRFKSINLNLFYNVTIKK
jgi:phosphatidylethanolamine/phosphatidyl-N-methylethanolamine N-methyltransferase